MARIGWLLSRCVILLLHKIRFLCFCYGHRTGSKLRRAWCSRLGNRESNKYQDATSLNGVFVVRPVRSEMSKAPLIASLKLAPDFIKKQPASQRV